MTMTGYNLVNLKELIEQVGESRTKEILSDFSCPLNKDVEYFLHSKAIEFAKQSISQTQLIFASYKGKPVLVAYFTLANKVIVLSKKTLTSTNWKRRIKKFAMPSDIDGNYHIPAPLIGQIGKNFSNGYNALISGDELLKLATDKIRETQAVLGGRFIYLECEDKAPLIQFYSENGFVEFGKRNLERDELDKQNGAYLIQMLKYMS